MDTKHSLIGSLALGAAALAFSTGAAGAMVAAGDNVHCYGVNSCKGQSDCKTASSACKGQNECKGHGFKAIAAKACLNDGGSIGDL